MHKSWIQASSAGHEFNLRLKTGFQGNFGNDVGCGGSNLNGFWQQVGRQIPGLQMHGFAPKITNPSWFSWLQIQSNPENRIPAWSWQWCWLRRAECEWILIKSQLLDSWIANAWLLTHNSQILADLACHEFNPTLKTGFCRNFGNDVDYVGPNVNGFWKQVGQRLPGMQMHGFWATNHKSKLIWLLTNLI